MICLTGDGCIYATTDGQRNAKRERSIWLMEIEVSAAVVAGYDGLSPEQKEENAKYLYYYLRNEGWSKEAICGLFGNIDRESGFNPAAYNKMNNLAAAYGLVQWIPGSDVVNKNDYEAVNEIAITNPKDLISMQLEYLVDQNTGRWYPVSKQKYRVEFEDDDTTVDMSFVEFITAKNNVWDLSLIYEATYERSEDSEEGLIIRASNAKKWGKFFEFYD